ncbi:MAG: hypothetical protein PHV06_00545 [bacterium]|nr:hypothetical protein [bacterium]
MINIRSFYTVFFGLLRDWEQLSNEDKQNLFYNKYFNLDPAFFNYIFFNYMNFSEETLNIRISEIKKSDYLNLISLCKNNHPENIIQDTLQKCVKVFKYEKNLDIYLYIGFFCPEGLNIKIKEKSNRIIAIGLERFKDFSSLEIITAHEYGHSLLEPKEELNIFEKIHREGIAFLFTHLVFPKLPIHKIIFLEQNQLSEIQDILPEIKNEIIKSEISVDQLFRINKKGLPDRSGNPLAFYYAYELYQKHGLNYLISTKDIEQSVINWCRKK